MPGDASLHLQAGTTGGWAGWLCLAVQARGTLTSSWLASWQGFCPGISLQPIPFLPSCLPRVVRTLPRP